MRIAQEEIFGPATGADPRARRSRRRSRSTTRSRYGLSSSIFTRDVNRAFPAMRDLEHGHRLRQPRHDRRRDAPAVRRHARHRQRPPRGRAHHARRVHRVEEHLRGLQRPAAAGADRQRRVTAASSSGSSRLRRSTRRGTPSSPPARAGSATTSAAPGTRRGRARSSAARGRTLRSVEGEAGREERVAELRVETVVPDEPGGGGRRGAARWLIPTRSRPSTSTRCCEGATLHRRRLRAATPARPPTAS